MTFNPLQVMVMTYSHAKVQGQQSVGSEDKLETNGRSDRRTKAIALPPVLTRSVITDRISVGLCRLEPFTWEVGLRALGAPLRSCTHNSERYRSNENAPRLSIQCSTIGGCQANTERREIRLNRQEPSVTRFQCLGSGAKLAAMTRRWSTDGSTLHNLSLYKSCLLYTSPSPRDS